MSKLLSRRGPCFGSGAHVPSRVQPQPAAKKVCLPFKPKKRRRRGALKKRLSPLPKRRQMLALKEHLREKAASAKAAAGGVAAPLTVVAPQAPAPVPAPIPAPVPAPVQPPVQPVVVVAVAPQPAVRIRVPAAAAAAGAPAAAPLTPSPLFSPGSLTSALLLLARGGAASLPSVTRGRGAAARAGGDGDGGSGGGFPVRRSHGDASGLASAATLTAPGSPPAERAAGEAAWTPMAEEG
jgi:hypothetical protein